MFNIKWSRNRPTPTADRGVPRVTANVWEGPPLVSEDERPVWFLDVDGVIAPYNSTPDCDRFLYRHAGGVGSVPYRQAVVDRIARMHASGLVEVRWLTTWGPAEVQEWQRAGLGPFALGDTNAEGPFSWWKANTVLAHLTAHPDQRVVWTDDDIEGNAHRARRVREAGGDRLLALAPERNVALTDEMLDQVEAWLRVGLTA